MFAWHGNTESGQLLYGFASYLISNPQDKFWLSTLTSDQRTVRVDIEKKWGSEIHVELNRRICKRSQRFRLLSNLNSFYKNELNKRKNK